MSEEEKKYFDSAAKRKWTKEHTTSYTVRLNHNQDDDLVKFMLGKPGAATIKAALREYMANHPEI